MFEKSMQFPYTPLRLTYLLSCVSSEHNICMFLNMEMFFPYNWLDAKGIFPKELIH